MVQRQLLKSFSVVSGVTLLSRVLGFIRDMVFANFLGAGMAFDAFLVAFRIPNLSRQLFAEGAFSQAFIPVLSEYRKSQSIEVVRRFIAVITGTLLAALLFLSLLQIEFAPYVVQFFAPGFSAEPEKFTLSVHLLQITSPYLILICWTALAGGIQNTYGRFAMSAFAPVLLNVVLISAAYLGVGMSWKMAETLSWAVLVAGFAQAVIQVPVLQNLKLLPWPTVEWHHPGSRKVWRLMGPALLGGGMAQLGFLIDTIFASFLVTGSVSWLYYSDRLTYFPLGIFGVALATVVLPHLSEQHAQKDSRAFSQSLDWAVKWVLMLSIPAALGLAMLAQPILFTLFYHGEFGLYDVVMTSKSLIAYSFGLPAFMLIKVLGAGFYARQDTKTPVRFAAISLLLNLGFNFLLMKPLHHAGLALATVLSASINAGLLGWMLVRQGVYRAERWGQFLISLLLSNVLLVSLLWLLHQDLAVWQEWSFPKRIEYLFLEIVAAGLVYGLIFYGARLQRRSV